MSHPVVWGFRRLVVAPAVVALTVLMWATLPGWLLVAAALADGSLDPARWQSYQRLRREAAFEVRRVDPRAARQSRDEWKKRTKQLRQRVREKSGEE